MKTVIAFVTVAAIAAVVGAIVVGSRSFEGIVTEKPYETGMAWDRTHHEKMEAGWEASVPEEGFYTGDAVIPVILADRQGKPLAGASVVVLLSRPHTTARDRTYQAASERAGLYTVSVSFPEYGYWDIKIGVSRDKKNVSFDKRIFVKRKGE